MREGAVILSTATAGAGIALAIAGASKLRHPATFVEQVRAYEILPPTLARLVGWALPALEIVIGIGSLRAPALLGPVVAGLYVLFAIAIAINLVRGRTSLSCGCFGPGNAARISRGHVGVNVVLAAMALASIGSSRALPVESIASGVSIALFLITMKLIVDLRDMLRASAGTGRA